MTNRSITNDENSKVAQLIEKSRMNFERVDRQITGWMARYALRFTRIGLGIIFFWFGALKLVDGLSPAEELIRNTIFFIDPDIFLPILAVWEMAIGVGLVIGRYMRVTLLLLFMQMAGTFTPLLFLPEAVWVRFPFVLTLEGQYIVKNLAIIGAALVLGATVRGGWIDPEPGLARVEG